LADLSDIPTSAGPALWTGPRHSGKTTGVARLVERIRADGLSVAGILAPSLWRDGRLTGFDLVDLATGQRSSLATRERVGGIRMGRFVFLEDGLALGRNALAGPAATGADLVVVDEYGPLELDGGGWRESVDRLIREASGCVLLVVRRSLIPALTELYNLPPKHVIDAASDRAVEAAAALVAQRRSSPTER